MKCLALAALLALSCPLAAQAKGSVAAKFNAARISAVEAQARPYLELQKQSQQIFLKLAAQLDKVADKASADEAAPQVAKLADAFIAVMQQAEKLGNPGPEVEAALVSYANAHKDDIEEVSEKAIDPMVNLMLNEPACYGSTALEGELGRLMEALRDAAWAEDEELSGCEGDDEDPSAGEAGEDGEELEDTEEPEGEYAGEDEEGEA